MLPISFNSRISCRDISIAGHQIIGERVITLQDDDSKEGRGGGGAGKSGSFNCFFHFYTVTHRTVLYLSLSVHIVSQETMHVSSIIKTCVRDLLLHLRRGSAKNM